MTQTVQELFHDQYALLKSHGYTMKRGVVMKGEHSVDIRTLTADEAKAAAEISDYFRTHREAVDAEANTAAPAAAKKDEKAVAAARQAITDKGARDGAKAGKATGAALVGVAQTAGDGLAVVGGAIHDVTTDIGEEAKKKDKDGKDKGVIAGTLDTVKDAGKSFGQKIGDFFKNIHAGGLIGGLLGVGGAWLISSIFGGGMIGMVMTALLAVPGFLIGRQMGENHLSGFFGGHNKGDKPAATPQQAQGAAPQQQTAQAPEKAANQDILTDPAVQKVMDEWHARRATRGAMHVASADTVGAVVPGNLPAMAARGRYY